MSDRIQPKISVSKTLSSIAKPWNPKMVSLLNDSIEFRVAKLEGEFVWHSHRDTDELFYIVEGGPLHMKIRHTFDDPASEETVTLEKGDIFVVPAGVQHLPVSANGVSVLAAEKKGELNTGDLGVTERTAVIEDARN